MRSILALSFIFLLIPLVASASVPGTVAVTFIINGQGTLTVLDTTGIIYNINKTTTLYLPADVAVTIISSQYFSINGSTPTSQYIFVPTGNMALNITFVQLVTKTNSPQIELKSILLVIVSILGLAFLYYVSRRSKEE